MKEELPEAFWSLAPGVSTGLLLAPSGTKPAMWSEGSQFSTLLSHLVSSEGQAGLPGVLCIRYTDSAPFLLLEHGSLGQLWFGIICMKTNLMGGKFVIPVPCHQIGKFCPAMWVLGREGGRERGREGALRHWPSPGSCCASTWFLLPALQGTDLRCERRVQRKVGLR